MNEVGSLPDRLVQKDKAVLVIIDMQEKLLPVVREPDLLLGNIVRLVNFAQIMGIPVLVTEQKNLGSTHKDIMEAATGVAPLSKLEFNCFCSEPFVLSLKELHRTHLILSGIEAHICVAQTALAAPSAFRVHVVADAVSSRKVLDRDVALDRMRQEQVAVTTAEMVMYEVMERADTARFKEVLQLVKEATR